MRRRFISKTNKKSYLTIEALEDNLQVKFSKQILYSIDEGVTWEVLTANTYSTSINIGQCIMFKAKLIPSSSALSGIETNGIGTFTISKKCNLKGNCMSMLFGDDATSNLSLSGKGYAFCRLFYNCTNIIGVSDGFLPATTLANNCYAYMFFGCSSLTTAPELPATTLADSCYNHMFYGCTSLTTAPELPATTLTSSCYYGMFNGCTSLQAFYGKYASSDNRCLIIDGVLNSFAPAGLTSYTIPNSVTEIGDYAFYGCSSLRSITIPNNITEIGESAFRGCTSLTSVTIPDSVTEIGFYAFYNCTSLKNVTIPDSVTSIGGSAFYGCNGELIIDIKYVERDYYLNNYPSAYGWLRGANFSKITIGNSVTEIGDYAFYECSSLTSVTIPDSVTSIGDSAFCNCTSLTSVTIPDSVTEIGNAAFGGCGSLTSVTIPDSITWIGNDAFYECSSLTSVTIPDSVTWIGRHAFDGCRSLTSITIPDSVTTIENSAFNGCRSLTSITIPDSVTSIGDAAFLYCTSLTSVTIPDSVTWIGSRVFQCCTSLQAFYGKYASSDNRCLVINGVLDSFAPVGLTSYTIPNSVTSIGYSAFYDCSSLRSITIPNNVTSIGQYAFSGCGSLTSVYCKPTTPPTLSGQYIFNGNASTRIIYVPMASVNAYKSATNWEIYASDIIGYNF